MPETMAALYLKALRYLRAHPSADDDEVAEACGIHRFDRDGTIGPARGTLRGEQGQ